MRVGLGGPPELSPMALSHHLWTALCCSKLANVALLGGSASVALGGNIWGAPPGQGTDKGWATAPESQQGCRGQVPAFRTLTKRTVWAKNKGRRVLQSPPEAG